jgi:hypothetical protein
MHESEGAEVFWQMSYDSYMNYTLSKFFQRLLRQYVSDIYLQKQTLRRCKQLVCLRGALRRDVPLLECGRPWGVAWDDRWTASQRFIGATYRRTRISGDHSHACFSYNPWRTLSPPLFCCGITLERAVGPQTTYWRSSDLESYYVTSCLYPTCKFPIKSNGKASSRKQQS